MCVCVAGVVVEGDGIRIGLGYVVQQNRVCEGEVEVGRLCIWAEKIAHISFPLCPRRLVLPFVPELNTGRRYQNAYLTVLWFLEIATYTNSSFNIFVYYSMGSKYRETMKALLCKGRVAKKLKNTDKEQTTTVSAVVSTHCA